MKYLKIIGLAAAAMALMAVVASSASATALYNGATKVTAGTEIKGTLVSGGSSKLTTTEGTTLNTCTASTVTGTISNAGSATETVSGTANATWNGCVSGAVTQIEDGTLEVHWISGTTNGTLTAKGFKITVNTILGPCVYTAGTGTHMGVVDGVNPGTATMTVNAVVNRLTGDTDTGTCPASGKWVANYSVTGFNNVEEK
jgi:hypothetical protein